MDLVKRYIFKQVGDGALKKETAKKLLVELAQSNEKQMDIAVIGISCVFPGCKDTEGYWNLLKDGINKIGPYPEHRKQDVALLNNQEDGKELANELYGGFLDEVDKFDYEFFRISPNEAISMDPFQRILLENAWKAFEDAGYDKSRTWGSKTGVFIGRDHAAGALYRQLNQSDQMAVTGNYTSILSSRISYVMNLTGPSLVLDTACSSALVAIHEACQSLKRQESHMALAGGINIIYDLNTDMISQIKSEDNRVKTFDKEADGTVWSEGVGIVLLKPLSKAVKDNDRIYGIIKGSAINNDGATNGITAPNPTAQTKVLLDAWQEAGIEPETITYIESHGTGTILGDPIEISGLTNAFLKYTKKKQFCAISSVKTNIGHTVAASGAASFIKVLLSMKHKMLPSNINFSNPNPYISFMDSPVYVNDTLREWKSKDSVRRAGVSSFGFNGTNCHVVLEEYKRPNKEPALSAKGNNNVFLFTLSAKKYETLQEMTGEYIQLLKENEEIDVGDLCYSQNTGRDHYNHRIALLCRSRTDLVIKLMQLMGQVRFSSMPEQGIYYNSYRMISQDVPVKRAGELYEAERKELTKRAEAFLKAVKENLCSEKNLYETAIYYINGASIDWKKFYEGHSHFKISLPPYALERKRCWPDVSHGSVLAEVRDYGKPLVRKILKETESLHIFSTDFNVDKFWIFKEHKVMGKSVCPGTAYLEMGAEAAVLHKKNEEYTEFYNIRIHQPLWMESGRTKQIITELQAQNKEYHFEIKDSRRREDTPVIYADGVIRFLPLQERPRVMTESLFKRCSVRETEIKDPSNEVFVFGDRWRGIQSVKEGKQEAIAEVVVPDAYLSELDEFILHPALFDCAGVLASRFTGENICLPYQYTKVKVYESLPGNFYCYIKYRNNDWEGDSCSFDVFFLDRSGDVLIEMEEYILKKVYEPASMLSEGNGNLAAEALELEKYLDQIILIGKDREEDYTKTEKTLACIWNYVIGMKEINIYDDLYKLGVDSILALKLAGTIEEVLKVEIIMADIIEKETIYRIAQYIDSMEQAEEKEEADKSIQRLKISYELSNAQERMWFLQKLRPDMYAYNLPVEYRIASAVDFGRLQRAFARLVQDNIAFRTIYIEENGVPKQVIKENADYNFEFIDLTKKADIESSYRELKIIADSHCFDLAKAVFIVKLIKLNQEDYVFYINVHHIAIDGWSVGILFKELFCLYERVDVGEIAEPKQEKFDYLDFVSEQKQWLGSREGEEAKEFWKDMLSSELPKQNLPVDYDYPKMQSFKGNFVPISFDSEEKGRLRTLAGDLGITMHMLFLSFFFLLLHKISGNDDIIIGVPYSCREKNKYRDIIGLLMNTICIRVKFTGAVTFHELVNQVKKNCIKAYKYANYPFDLVVRDLDIDRDLSQNAVYNSIYQYFENIPDASQHVSLMDLSLMGKEGEAGIDMRLEYNTEIFEVETVTEIGEKLKEMIGLILQNNEFPLEEINAYTNKRRMAVQKKTMDEPALEINIVISATFTADPLSDYIKWWCDKFNIHGNILMAPYHQVFQQLLQEDSLLGSNRGFLLLLIRFEDFIRELEVSVSEKIAVLDKIAVDLEAALSEWRGKSQLHIGLLPLPDKNSTDQQLYSHYEKLMGRWERFLKGAENLHIVDLRQNSIPYGDMQIYDETADKLGHIPYTEAYYMAAGTVIARNICVEKQAPFKVIVVDCDNTLWLGICAEDGSRGVKLTKPYLYFQQFLLEQRKSGMLLALCSKNNRRDVEKVFKENPQMILSLDDFIGVKVNWNRKSDNLKELASELSLSLNSFIFLDDSPAECMEVISNCSQVLTVQIPSNSSYIPHLLKHLWAFDRKEVTLEDTMRNSMYQAEKRREEITRQSNTYNDFIEELQLKVCIYPAKQENVQRIAQLTQRTNQFNNCTRRRAEGEIKQLMGNGICCYVIEVADRFGSYGIVGTVFTNTSENTLHMETFLLSCRVLGREVETAVLSYFGEQCRENGLEQIRIPFYPTERNQPVKDFLDRMRFSVFAQDNKGDIYSIQTSGIPQMMNGITFIEKEERKKYGFIPSILLDGEREKVINQAAQNLCFENSYEHPIKNDNRSVTLIDDSILEKAEQASMRHYSYLLPLKYADISKLSVALIKKSPDELAQMCDEQSENADITKEIIEVWERVLKVKNIQPGDSFFSLGGNSLKVVQAISQLSRFRLEIQDFFNNKTATKLSEYIRRRDLAKAELSGTQGPVSYRDKLSATKNAESTKGAEYQKTDAVSKIIDNVEPFNEIFYRDCVYNALFPALIHYGKGIDNFLANDIIFYTMEEENWKSLDAKVHSCIRIDELLESSGLEVHLTAKEEDIIGACINAIAQDKLVILRVDCFYESMRKDTYEKLHWPHYLLIFGYDNDSEIFHILEHENIDSFKYKKKTMPYHEARNCYEGYLEHFNKNYEHPSFYEIQTAFGFDEYGGTPSDIYIDNFINQRKNIIVGIKKLNYFMNEIGVLALERSNEEDMEILLYHLNNLINLKKAERYKAEVLYGHNPVFLEPLDKLVQLWKKIRTLIIKLQYSNKADSIKKSLFTENLTLIKQLETEYFERLLLCDLKEANI